jgi:hypothetical protein
MTAVKAGRGETAAAIPPPRRTSGNRRAPVDGDISGRGRRFVQTPEQQRSAALIGGAACGFVMLLILGILVFGPDKNEATKKPSDATKKQAGDADPAATSPARTDTQPAGKRETVGPGALRRVSEPAKPEPRKQQLDDGTGVRHRPGPSVLSPIPEKQPQPKAKPPIPPSIPKKSDPADTSKAKTPAPTPDLTSDLAGRDRRREVEEEEDPEDRRREASPGNRKEDKTAKAVNPLAPEAKKPPAPPKPPKVIKPVYVRGKNCDLFPRDRDSTVGEHVSPAADVGQKASSVKETKYPGWTWQARNRTGFDVKQGILTMKSQGSLLLDAFDAIEYNLSFDVKLGRNSVVGIQMGSAKGGIPIMLLLPNGVVPGIFDPSKKKGQVKAAKKGGRAPLNGWASVRVAVRRASVEVFVGNRRVLKGRPALRATGPLFGFLCLGTQNNRNPRAQLRKVQVFAP